MCEENRHGECTNPTTRGRKTAQASSNTGELDYEKQNVSIERKYSLRGYHCGMKETSEQTDTNSSQWVAVSAQTRGGG